MSRGNREGNNALIHDVNRSTACTGLDEEEIMMWDLPDHVIQEARRLKIVGDNELIENVPKAIRWGNRELAAQFMEIDMKKNKVCMNIERHSFGHLRIGTYRYFMKILFCAVGLHVQPLPLGRSDLLRRRDLDHARP